MAISAALSVALGGHPMVSLPPGIPVPRSSGAHGLDKTWFLDVNQFARSTGWLHGPMLAYATTYGVVLLGLMLVIGWWLARGQGPRAVAAALWAGAGTIIAVGVAQPINHAVAEARPWESLPNALILAGHTYDFSFPSDHGIVAGAVVAGIFIYNRRLAIVATIIGLLLMFGRVYIGAHYPQDVAGGFVIGAAVVLIGYLIVRIPLRMAVEWLADTPLRPLVATGPRPGGAGQPAGSGAQAAQSAQSAQAAPSAQAAASSAESGGTDR